MATDEQYSKPCQPDSLRQFYLIAGGNRKSKMPGGFGEATGHIRNRLKYERGPGAGG